ncbi:MAG: PAS domain S-box protein [Desulfobacterales bacterium]|nr:PAS domain S-box protein [Desulfobacterales bacterium]
MLKKILALRHSLIAKLILTVGLTLLVSIATWAYFTIDYQKNKVMADVIDSADRLTTTIRLGTHYAMMLNSRDDINQIITNIGGQEGLDAIRIYNKAGQIKFSNRNSEVDHFTNIRDEACHICHRTEPPQEKLGLAERTRIVALADGYRHLGIISPIFNEPGCSTDPCHVHPESKKVLGALDVVVSLKETDRQVLLIEKGIIGLAGVVFLLTSTGIFLLVMTFVNQPVRKLIAGTRRIGHGDYRSRVDIRQEDEMGQLARAINRMGEEIAANQEALNQQRDEYQNLFETVPCLITVQDREFRLLQYNREFANKFAPHPGDFCYRAYKGRRQKCEHCPVEKTFADGQSHSGEEMGYNKDGTVSHWIYKTTPVLDDRGQIVAAMEMSLDITPRKLLAEKLEKSEQKYRDIFTNIPNPVFVLDLDTLNVLDCNQSVERVYGFTQAEILRKPFLDIFAEEDRDHYAFKLMTSPAINRVKHRNRAGEWLYVDIRVSPSEFQGRKVLLVTTSDITKQLLAEQQLIQASKMATLGEMATGVAHELNQPLSVIKTASSFLRKKVSRREPIQEEILYTLTNEIDGHVDRATKIISHMREFGRQSDVTLAQVQLNQVLDKAFEFFSQQLKVRGIAVARDYHPNLPLVMADADRLEQVFINLLINARDAIEDHWQAMALPPPGAKRIDLKTYLAGNRVVAEVADSGGGIPEALRDRIFEPFFTTKEVGKGTGLGLSISYGIVKDCGGDIQVVSAEGQGACFRLSFPVAGES